MARPLSFDPQAALDKAMRLFWRDGFAQVSIQALTEELGINRPSLYATFGDKETLFLKVLQAYRDRYPGRALAAMRQAKPGRAQLDALFANVRDTYTDAGTPCGCLLMRTIMEWTKEGPILDFLQAFRAEFMGEIRKAVAAAQRNGEIDPHKDPDAVAKYVMFMVKAVAMEARATGERAHVGAMIAQGLHAL